MTVSLLVLRKGGWAGEVVLNNHAVDQIGSKLSIERATQPLPLLRNKGLCSDGTKIQGDGFIITEVEKLALLKSDRANARVLRPYITGMDMVQGIGCRPAAWIISFGLMSLEEASRYKEPLAILVERVKPYRDALTGQIHERDYWKFWDKREEFFAGMSGKGRILACPSTSKYWIVTFLDEGWVASHSVKLFAFSEFHGLAVMQSSIHEAWAREESGKLEQRLAYNLSKAFATYPWPVDPCGAANAEALSRHRAELSERRHLCFTDIYNLVHDQSCTDEDISRLRILHKELDREVAAAYRWNAFDLDHGFHETKQGVRFTISELARREVLARLLKLNHERHAEEVTQGLHDKKGKARKTTGGRGPKPKLVSDGSVLFGDDDEEPAPPDVDADQSSEVEKPARNRRTRMITSADDEAASRPTPIEELDTDDIMAAFRQATRNRGWLERDELVKDVSAVLGFQRLGPKIDEALRGHLRAAIRRRIIEADGASLVRAGTGSMTDYGLDELREAFRSVMRKGTNYEREDVTHALARYLGFARVTDTSRDAIKSAINSAIRQSLLGYEGTAIWRLE